MATHHSPNPRSSPSSSSSSLSMYCRYYYMYILTAMPCHANACPHPAASHSSNAGVHPVSEAPGMGKRQKHTCYCYCYWTLEVSRVVVRYVAPQQSLALLCSQPYKAESVRFLTCWFAGPQCMLLLRRRRDAVRSGCKEGMERKAGVAVKCKRTLCGRAVAVIVAVSCRRAMCCARILRAW